jgi:hypothetical protein
LDFVAAEDVHGLWRQAHVRAHRHAAFGQQADRLGQPGAPSILTMCAPACISVALWKACSGWHGP